MALTGQLGIVDSQLTAIELGFGAAGVPVGPPPPLPPGGGGGGHGFVGGHYPSRWRAPSRETALPDAITARGDLRLGLFTIDAGGAVTPPAVGGRLTLRLGVVRMEAAARVAAWVDPDEELWLLGLGSEDEALLKL